MDLLGSIDQGTTSSRFIVFTKDGEQVCVSQMEHKQIMPQKGYVEHDAMEIWVNVVECINRVMKDSSMNGNTLKCIGITNQRETTVCWSKSTGLPICNAVVWMDMRSQQICNVIQKDLSPEAIQKMRETTGLPISPYFSATKIKWLVENNPTVAAAIKANPTDISFGTIDSWLMFKLSNNTEFLTDVTNASRYALMDLKTLKWDQAQLEFWGVKENWLPSIVPSSESLFKVTAPELSLVKDVEVSGVIGDQQAAMLGQLCVEKHSVKNTYGTGCFMLYNTGTEVVYSKNGLLTTVLFMRNGVATFGLEGSVAIGGAIIQWLRDNLQIISDAKESEELAKTVTDNGGVYFVPAFSGLYAPYWRSDARGAIVGLTRFANKGHFARAALEATAFQVNDLKDAMLKDVGRESLGEMRVDGGMVHNKLLLQLQCDISQLEVVVPKVVETTAMGAAFAAGLGCGIYSSFDDVKDNWKFSQKVVPQKKASEMAALHVGWKKAVKRTLNWTDESESLDII